MTPTSYKEQVEAICAELQIPVPGKNLARVQAQEAITALTIQLLRETGNKIIGQDSNPDPVDREFMSLSDIEDIELTAQNELRAHQRSVLDQTIESLGATPSDPELHEQSEEIKSLTKVRSK